MASIPGMFRNTISLFGLSKAYGMASLRSGFVVADEIIIREIVNRIFQEMDAVPAIIGEALAGGFNDSDYRNKEYDKYFNELRQEYKIEINKYHHKVNNLKVKIPNKSKNYISTSKYTWYNFFRQRAYFN